MDEFLALCAAQPALVLAFDAIIECGLRLAAQQRDGARLAALFRAPISPDSRCVRSPTSGLRRPPSLVHLRPLDEVLQQHASKHAASSRW